VASIAQRLAHIAEGFVRREAAGAVELLGPVAAPLERIRNRTRWQIWLRGADRHALRRVARGMLAADVATKVRIALDVDPMSAM
jgi:primosomal protein N' (replication factor Y)